MGFLIPDDPGYDPEIRQVGFARYRQCLSLYAGGWMKVNALTVLGVLPLAAAIAVSVLSSSVLLLLPGSFLGGMLSGPFLAGLYDAVLRGLRDDPMGWWDAYRKSWRQDGRESLLPGGIFGLLLGGHVFMAALLWWSRIPPSMGTLVLYAASAFLLILAGSLYWPQMVLFRQTAADRIRNAVLFTAKYSWRVAGAILSQMLYVLILVLFAPWTVLLVPILGLWYPVFVALSLIYVPLDRELQIEERSREASDPSSGT